MPKHIVIAANSYERGASYARENGLVDARIYTPDNHNTIRGRMIDKLIILDPLTDHQNKVLLPALIGAEVTYG
jgi:hypothetical protein